MCSATSASVSRPHDYGCFIIIIITVIIIGPHCSTTYMRPIATDGVAWSVSRSVARLVCVSHDREPCKKWLNRLRYHLRCGIGLSQGTMY